MSLAKFIKRNRVYTKKHYRGEKVRYDFVHNPIRMNEVTYPSMPGWFNFSKLYHHVFALPPSRTKDYWVRKLIGTETESEDLFRLKYPVVPRPSHNESDTPNETIN